MSKKPFINRNKDSFKKIHLNKLSSYIPLSGATVSFIYAFIFEFYFSYSFAATVVLTYFVLYLFSLILIKYHFFKFGLHFVTVVFLSEIAFHALYLFPVATSFHLFFLVGVPLIYMFFDRQQQFSRYFYTSLSLFLLVFVEFSSYTAQISQPHLTPEMIGFIRNANVLSSVLVLSLSIMLFTNMMENAESLAIEESNTDHLTGLTNRRRFFLYADSMMTEHQQSYETLSLCFLDLDHFKSINDQYGHDLGDQVLISVSNVLKDKIQEPDIVARIGGEEFVVIFANTHGKSAIKKAEELRQAVLNMSIPDIKEDITMSIGLTQLYPQDFMINELLKRADEALYQAKANGRNRIETYFF